MIVKRWLARRRGFVVKSGKHGIKPSDISGNAAHAVKQLQSGGHQAYVVGGAVRDILLGFRPKDFDVATDAEPEQVRRLFRRTRIQSRVIGRRFRIVHLYYRGGRGVEEIIEVSTFRAKSGDADNADNNIYGTAAEDAQRRDFTANALLYDPCGGDIVDYVGGVDDIKRQRLRMIGAAAARLPEDPVRVLRAIRLAAKLGLTLDAKLEKLLPVYAPLLADIPKSRLFDELVKALKSGASARVLEQWRHYDVPRHIMPVLAADNPLFFSALAENDRRLSEERDSSVSFILASLCWPHVAAAWRAHCDGGEKPLQAMARALADAPVFAQCDIVPQRLLGRVREMFFLQAMMEAPLTRRRVGRVLRDELFARALAFSATRQDKGAATTASWWSQYATGDKAQQERMLAQLSSGRWRRREKGEAKKGA